jgi:hypothetical protein
LLALPTLLIAITATVIEVTKIGTVKLGLIEHRIDLIMDEAGPARSGIARRNLRWIFAEMLLEM